MAFANDDEAPTLGSQIVQAAAHKPSEIPKHLEPVPERNGFVRIIPKPDTVDFDYGQAFQASDYDIFPEIFFELTYETDHEPPIGFDKVPHKSSKEINGVGSFCSTSAWQERRCRFHHL